MSTAPVLFRIKCVLFIGFLFFGGSVFSQHNITSSGSDGSSAAGSIAVSVGQLVYTEVIQASGGLHQGVEIAFEMSDGQIPGPRAEGCLCVYPNPTDGVLILEVPAFLNEHYSFKLFNCWGVQLAEDDVQSIRSSLYLDVLPAAVYLLQVHKHGDVVETFKILKK